MTRRVYLQTNKGVDLIRLTLFDPQSIMLYMFPPELFTDHKSTNNNTDLSDKDKAFIAQMYPH